MEKLSNKNETSFNLYTIEYYINIFRNNIRLRFTCCDTSNYFLCKKQTNTFSNILLNRNQNDYSALNENFKPTSKQDAINRVNHLKTEQRELKSTLDRHEKII